MAGKKREKKNRKPTYKVQKVVRLTRKGLDYVRNYKKPCIRVTSHRTIYAARQWNKLSPALQERFKNMMETEIDIRNTPQEIEGQSNREGPVKNKREKKGMKRQAKKIKCSPNAYLNFLRLFKEKNPTLETNDLLKESARMWRCLQGHQRRLFGKPL
ncbi:hypothetical protein KR084_001375 [Drosophila pseudotakahashii]|nr:hypothetical protein KR084_001375 [Drosophila pseudotakahashii]